MSGQAQPPEVPEEGIRLEDPALLERYHGIDPDLAKRSLEQALVERERAAEAALLERRWKARRADTLAAALAFAAAGYVAGLTYLAGAGKPWIGAAAFAAGLLAWYLLEGRRG